mgnify:CR=1 FL=1
MFAIGLIVDRQLRQKFLFEKLILLLEHAGVFALFVGLGIVAVLHHLVDEEERQHLDALGEELLLLVEVRLDRLADLDAPYVAL